MAKPQSNPIRRVDGDAQDRLEEVSVQARQLEKSVRIRCDLRLLNPETVAYRYWPDAHWAIDVPPDGTGLLVREAFYQLVRALTSVGPEKVIERLKSTT